jgi:hypothetical protein
MRHYSADVLGSYSAGLLSVRKRARISSHLSVCARCTGTSAEITAVSVVLRSVPAPQLPESVTARIEMVIARESAVRAGSAAAAPNGFAASEHAQAPGRADIPGRPDLPERPRRTPRRLRMSQAGSPLVLRALATTGVLVLVVAAGFLFANRLGSSSSGPSARRASSYAPRAAALPATRSLTYHVGRALETTSVVTSHADLTPKTLAGQVRKDARSYSAMMSGGVNVSASSTPAPSAATTPTSAGTRLGVFRAGVLEGCLTRIAAGRTVLTAEVARYLGRPAAIIVLAPVATSNIFKVFVVGLACSASVSDLITSLKVSR